MGRVRVDPCRRNGHFGRPPTEGQGLLLRGHRVVQLLKTMGRSNVTLIPLSLCFGKSLMGIRLNLYGNGGLRSGHRITTGHSTGEAVSHTLGRRGEWEVFWGVWFQVARCRFQVGCANIWEFQRKF